MEVVAVRSRARMAEQPGLHLVVGLEEEEEAKNKIVKMILLAKLL